MSGIEDDPTLPDAGRPLFGADAGDTPRVLGGRYILEEQLGTGGGATVWRAFDEALSRTVAVKVLRPRTRGAGADAEQVDPVARLRREAATAGRAAHPGIVAVYDTGTDGDVAWLALEHVAGPTLLDVLRHHPRGLRAEVAAAVAEQTAVGLGHAHRRGLVHRDVKPSNLLLTGDGVVKLADFGVAATADGHHRPELAGSRGYAPPEQLEGREGSDQPQVDVFSLGVVLHECLTGRPAFLGPGRRADQGAELLSPRQVRPDVPRELDAIVRRATRTAPAERFADAAAMATALRPLVPSDPFELVRTLVRPGPGGRAVPAAAPRAEHTDPAEHTTPADGAADTAAPDRPPRSVPDWRWIAAAVAVLVTTGLLTSLAVSGDVVPRDDPTAVADVGIPVTQVSLFDPYGSVTGGSSEPAAAIDGDPDTAWRTPTYPVPLRSLGTAGVGIWIDAGAPQTIEQVELDLATGGVTVELLAADTAPAAGTTEADWRSLDRTTRPGSTATLTAGGATARYWLVWFTELEPVGETWQAALTDLRFHPAGTP